MATLKITKDGVSGLEFIPPGVLTRFLGNSVLDDMYLFKSTVGSLADESLEFSGNTSQPVSTECSIFHLICTGYVPFY